MSYCGIMLTGEEGGRVGMAFLTADREVECVTVTDDEAIMDQLEQHRPEVIVLNAPPEREKTSGFRKGEEELIEEGYNLLPQGMRDRRLLERAEFLTNTIMRSGLGATVIESEPTVAAEKLDITGDDHLEARGLEVSGVNNTLEFDALVLAWVGKLYVDEETEEKSLIVPQVEEDQNDAKPIREE